MNLWDTVTGNDLTRDWTAFNKRAANLPADYQSAWQQITLSLMAHGDFTGRNLTPIADGVLGFLETTASEGQSAKDALGDDIAGFCAALMGEDSATKSYRQKWRDQLNRNVERKLAQLGD
ncbi:MAG TPA: DUF1048 domain-containing protein [Galbitalea sp.]|jgi:DNA-binding ferritin-like protein (Dps family)